MNKLVLVILMSFNIVAMDKPKHHDITIYIDQNKTPTKTEPEKIEQKSPESKTPRQRLVSYCNNESVKIKLAIITAITTIAVALIVNLTKCSK